MPPPWCPVCDSRSLVAIRRKSLLPKLKDDPGKVIGYYCENGHFIAASAEPDSLKSAA
jgi:hypothetical protein